MKKSQKRPGPKPIILDPAEIEELSFQGLNQREVCERLGISADTMQRRCAVKVDFARAFSRARARLCVISGKKVMAEIAEQKTRHLEAVERDRLRRYKKHVAYWQARKQSATR